LDLTLEKIESKIIDVLGPLSRLWKTLEDVNSDPDTGEVYLDDMFEKVQK